MRKVSLALGICLVLMAAPVLAGPLIDIPAGEVNFNGDGSFDQTIPGTFDPATGLPIPPVAGTELFGVGTISGVEFTSDPGNIIWLPADVGPDFEMSYSFWDAVVVTSGAFFDPITGLYFISANYADDAHLVFVSDISGDFTNAAAPTTFDTVTGDYATAYTLPAGGAAVDPDEEVYLDLLLSGSSSVIYFNPFTGSFLGAAFSSQSVEILGGYGAAHFIDYFGPDGTADAFIWNIEMAPDPGNLLWLYKGDTDVTLHAVPEPAALISLCTGLALLGGMRLRRKA